RWGGAAQVELVGRNELLVDSDEVAAAAGRLGSGNAGVVVMDKVHALEAVKIKIVGAGSVIAVTDRVAHVPDRAGAANRGDHVVAAGISVVADRIVRDVDRADRQAGRKRGSGRSAVADEQIIFDVGRSVTEYRQTARGEAVDIVAHDVAVEYRDLTGIRIV